MQTEFKNPRGSDSEVSRLYRSGELTIGVRTLGNRVTSPKGGREEHAGEIMNSLSR